MTFLKNSDFLFLTLLLFFLNCITFCHSDPSQNIEVIYHLPSPPPSPSPSPAGIPPSNLPPPSQPQTPPPPKNPSRKNAQPSKRAVATAVIVTAFSTLLVAALLLFLCTKCERHKKKEENDGGRVLDTYNATARDTGAHLQPVVQKSEFTKFDGNVKGLIIDEGGLDVLYWRKLEGSQRKSGSFHKDFLNKSIVSVKRNFSRGKSSSSNTQNQVHPKDVQKQQLLDPKLSASDHASHSSEKSGITNENQVVPPPPALPPIVVAKKAAPPPPPPIPSMNGAAPPPPPPKGLPRRPPAPKRIPSGNAVVAVSALGGDDASSEEKIDQVPLKPLHWDKVKVDNRSHSMVWDKLGQGSFQYDGNMMEALFGTVAKDRKSPKDNAATKTGPDPTAKIFILDSRRSQNIAIVIRSLGISRRELIDGLLEGKGLNPETLEKLTRMAPTREEKIQILAFDGEIGKLADAESFLYHILKVVPSAFTRVNAMLFRHTYDSEIQQLKDMIQTLDFASTELRAGRIFFKLLEAILKAGNRLNAGTARGNAKAFNLTALRKLSDYKSSDGKTTLLHFVVHEVVRNEGRRCVMNQVNSLTRSNSQTNPTQIESKSKEEQEKEFLKLGLPIVGGLSSEFSNVMKSSSIDYDTLSNISTSLETWVVETRQLVLQCGADGSGSDFIKEMKEFLEEAEGEIKAVKEEQDRVMESVMKTTQYFQSGGFKGKQPLLMFAIVKDFLGMVDKACVEITRSLQQKKADKRGASSSGSTSSQTVETDDLLRTRVTFPRLPDHFLTEKSNISDSDDER